MNKKARKCEPFLLGIPLSQKYQKPHIPNSLTKEYKHDKISAFQVFTKLI